MHFASYDCNCVSGKMSREQGKLKRRSQFLICQQDIVLLTLSTFLSSVEKGAFLQSVSGIHISVTRYEPVTAGVTRTRNLCFADTIEANRTWRKKETICFHIKITLGTFFGPIMRMTGRLSGREAISVSINRNYK